MTDERDKNVTDELVSKTYRELPSTQAPDHLNRTILQMAAKKGPGKNKFPFAAWMKPVAWAATIGLSLAIVLELSELPVAPASVGIVSGAESQTSSKNQSNADSIRIEEPAALAEVVAEERRLEQAQALKSEAQNKADSLPAPTPALARPAARKVSRARATAGPAAAASFERSNEAKESETAMACDIEIRQTAADWRDCIDNLRESGATQEADREYEAFILEYPAQLPDPEPNK